MSILRLRKVTLLGHIGDKHKVLDELQTLGCLHLIPMEGGAAARAGHGSSQQARDALRFLLECPQKRRQARDTSGFQAIEVEQQALELKRRLQDLQDERDFLIKRIKDLEPWGDFQFPARQGLDYLRLWFYLVPNYRLAYFRVANNSEWSFFDCCTRFPYLPSTSFEVFKSRLIHLS